MLDTNEERSLGQLFVDLAREMSTLVRREVQLARAELAQHAVSAATGAAFLIVAASLAFVGFQALVAALILAVSQILAPWLAALLVGLALLIIAGILVPMALGKFRKAAEGPQQTVETIREDVQWTKEQMG